MCSKENDKLPSTSKAIIIVALCVFALGWGAVAFFMAKSDIDAQRNTEYVLEEVADDEYTLEEE